MSIPAGSFDEVYVELAKTRVHYDELRADDGPLHSRATARHRLHELRSQLAILRESR